MALGGGTFLVQNKILPGAYINFVSRPRALGTLGERGTAAMMLNLNWGTEGEVFTVETGDFQKECLSIFGYAYTDDKMLYLREIFKGAKTLKIYRPSSGDKAALTVDGLTVRALCGGTRGNDIKIAIEQDIDEDGMFTVTTFIGTDNTEVDSQTVSAIEELAANDFVSFSGSGSFTEMAAASLTGGTDIALTGNDYSVFLDKIEAEDFNTLLYAGTDSVTKSLFDSFTKRLRDSVGYKITTVLYNYPKADFEGVISVKNPVTGLLEESTAEWDEAGLVYWVAGKTAGATVKDSLTNNVYDGELAIFTKYKESEFTAALKNGEFVFYGEKDEIMVLDDINTFTSIEPYKNSDFSDNQIIRVLDEIANGTARVFNSYYLGKVQNSDTGRNLLKAELIKYHDDLQGLDAITNFSADDIEIIQGVEKGDVVVNEAVQPVGTMKKLYMTVEVI